MMPYSTQLTCSTRPPKPALFQAAPHSSNRRDSLQLSQSLSTDRIKGAGTSREGMYIEIGWHVSTSTEMDPCTSTYSRANRCKPSCSARAAAARYKQVRVYVLLYMYSYGPDFQGRRAGRVVFLSS